MIVAHSAGKRRKFSRHRLVDLAPERHDERGDVRQQLPAPRVELRLLVVAPRGHRDLAFITGEEREITMTAWRNDQEPEFDAWRWELLANVAALVVPFRREVYQAVAREFAPFAG